MPGFFKKSATRPGIFRSVNEDLRLAAAQGDLARAQELISKGARFVPDKDRRSALHLACIGGHTQLVQFFIESGCDLNLQDKLGYTALHRAGLEGHVETVRLLLDSNAKPDKQDCVQENTPLHEAAWHGHSAVLELLLQAKANVYIRNKTGSAPLQLACQNGHVKCCRLLLQSGCKVDLKDKYDDTPLHTASRYMHSGVTKLLLESSANPNEQNKNGDTPLHLACNLGQRKVSKLLMEFGADSNLKNKQGESPLDIAGRKHLVELIDILKEQPASSGTTQSKSVAQLNRERKSRIRERLRASRGEGSTWQLLFQDWNPTQKICAQTGGSLQSPVDGVAVQPLSLGQMQMVASSEQQQIFMDLAGNVKKGPVCGNQCACFCAPIFYQFVKQNNEVHRELLDEIDACHNELSNEIQDLRHVTDRKLNTVAKALNKKTGAVETLKPQQMMCYASRAAVPGARIAHNDNTFHQRPTSFKSSDSCSNPWIPQQRGYFGTSVPVRTNSHQYAVTRGRLVRSKSESELETDIERERTLVDLDTDSLSNCSDDLYIERELHHHYLSNYTRCGGMGPRAKSRSRASRVMYPAASTQVLHQPIITTLSPQEQPLNQRTFPSQQQKTTPCRESAPNEFETATSKQQSANVLSPSTALLQRHRQFIESVKQFNNAQRQRQSLDDHDSIRDSSCNSALTYNSSQNCGATNTTTTTDTSNRSSLYSYNSQLSQLSSVQPSMDSGYGSNSKTMEDINGISLVTSSTRTMIGCSPWTSTNGIASCMNELSPDWAVPDHTTQLQNISTPPRVVIPSISGSMATQPDPSTRAGVGFVPISPVAPSTPSSMVIDLEHHRLFAGMVAEQLEKTLTQVSEVQTQTDFNVQHSNKHVFSNPKPVLGMFEDNSNDYTELDLIQNQRLRNARSQKRSTATNSSSKLSNNAGIQRTVVDSVLPLQSSRNRASDPRKFLHDSSVVHKPPPVLPIPPPPRKPLPPLPQLPETGYHQSSAAPKNNTTKSRTPQMQRKTTATHHIQGHKSANRQPAYYCMSTNV